MDENQSIFDLYYREPPPPPPPKTIGYNSSVRSKALVKRTKKIIDKSNILTYTISEPERFREAARIKLYCAWAGNIPGL